MLTDLETGAELDRGYLISAKDLAATRSPRRDRRGGRRLPQGRGTEEEPGVRRHRDERLPHLPRPPRRGRSHARRSPAEVEPLVQIYSRGFTGGMYGGRAGSRVHHARPARQSRRRARRRGRHVTGASSSSRCSAPLHVGDGVGFEPPDQRGGRDGRLHGRRSVRTLSAGRRVRQALALPSRLDVGDGWRVVRSSEAALLERARASYAALPAELRQREDAARRARCSDRRAVRSRRSSPPTARRSRCGPRSTSRRRPSARSTTRRCASSSADWARRRSRSAALETAGLAPGLFLPVSELNHLRQQAVDELLQRRDWAREALLAERRAAIDAALALSASRARAARPPSRRSGHARSISSPRSSRSTTRAPPPRPARPTIVLDPFLRHPTPPRHARARARRGARGAGRHAAPSHADDRAARGAAHGAEVARPRAPAAQRSPRARRRAVARRARRDRRLRRELLQPAHRGGAVPARRAPHRAVGGADDRRAARRRRAVGGRRLRRAALRPSRRG